jgi:tetratricopeptide (TPR) repeat protein
VTTLAVQSSTISHNSSLELALGSDHPDTASTLNDLAVLAFDRGRYGEAEALLKRALSIRETQLGAGHSVTLQSLDNLAGLYQNQGKLRKAALLYKRVKDLYE